MSQIITVGEMLIPAFECTLRFAITGTEAFLSQNDFFVPFLRVMQPSPFSMAQKHVL